MRPCVVSASGAAVFCGFELRKCGKSCSFADMSLREMDRPELERLFRERREALLEVRDELDRRDRELGKPRVNVDFTKYVGDGIEW